MLTNLQVKVLKRIAPGEPNCCNGSAYAGKSKLAMLLGADFFSKIRGKRVVDFGCGDGSDAVEMATNGAERVVGIDLRLDLLQVGREKARLAQIEDRCAFATATDKLADVVVSLDGFEHFSDPAEVLRVMHSVLQADGEVYVCFGPTWYHPHGGHLFSVFPWAHLLFGEPALLAWRSTFTSDGATRFGEVTGGLNCMTIKRFEELVARSPLKFAAIELVPIRKLRGVHCRLTREFTTAVVRCRLVKRTGNQP